MIDKIDLVYLWVDGSDSNWAKKKATELSKLKGTPLNQDAIDSCRFIQNDELKYSLRSVEKYAPWINHIYIVTDNQIPSWLNTNNKKITIIDHKDIIPTKYLPTFNASAIEPFLVNIPNLSEYFLLANDDTFFWNFTNPEFFFTEENLVICRLGKQIKNKLYKHPYGSMVNNSYKLIKNTFNVNIPYFPHHGIDGYKKQAILDCNNIFKKQIDLTAKSKFRELSNFQRALYSYYMIYKKIGILQRPINKFLWFETSIKGYIPCKKNKLYKAQQSQYPIMCINDGRSTTESDRKIMTEILQQKFPNKSQFEK